jgi:quinol monooxygenase YgiN
VIGVTVVWRARPGCEAAVETLLREMQRRTRLEPGCLSYEIHSTAELATYVLQERYADLAAVDAHHATAHYVRLVSERAPHLVQSREIFRGELL